MDDEIEKWPVTTQHRLLFAALSTFDFSTSTLNIHFYSLDSKLFLVKPYQCKHYFHKTLYCLINSSFRKLENLNKIYHAII